MNHSTLLTMIPEVIKPLKYSKHAIKERLKDRFGFIKYVPMSFRRSGCKRCIVSEPNIIKVVYIYNDKTDLNLIINIEEQLVITNYLTHSDNKNQFKGRFKFAQD